jgi:hypothetical protein
MTTEQLQVALGRLRAGRAPLPLTTGAAIEYAVTLRARGWTWRAIADVMADYHGVAYDRSWWCRTCRNWRPR